MNALMWLRAADIYDCGHCNDLIGVGDPCAWIPRTDELVCLDCGGAADQQATGRAA